MEAEQAASVIHHAHGVVHPSALSLCQRLYGPVPIGSTVVLTWFDADRHMFCEFYRPTEIEKMLADAFSLSVHNDVYLRPSVLSRIPESGRGKEDDTLGSSALWVDLDYEKEGRSRREAHAALSNFTPAPSILVHSGHGFHAYWLLSGFCGDPQAVKEMNKWLAGQFSPYGADRAYDLARLLRIPGTWNRKIPDDIRQVELLPSERQVVENSETSEDDYPRYETGAFMRSPIKRIETTYEYFDPAPVPTNFLEEVKERSEKLYGRIVSEETALEKGALVTENGKRVDRSLNDWYVTCILLTMGYSPEVCFSVLTHPTWFVGSKFRQRNDFRYVLRTINRAKAATKKRSLDSFFVDKTFMPAKLGNFLMEDDDYLYVMGSGLMWYDEGVFSPHGKIHLQEMILAALGEVWRPYHSESTIAYVEQTTTKLGTEVERAAEFINVKNGMLHLETRKLHPHGPGYLSLTQFPVYYDEQADTSRVDEFVASILPEDCIDVWWEFVGYCFLSDYRFKSMLLLTGPTDTGKSQILNLLTDMLGKNNTSSVDLSEFVNNRFALADLFGKAANLCADISTTIDMVNTERVKWLVGGDQIRGERKFEHGFDFVNRAKLIFSANGFPAIRRPDEATYGRFVVIPCEKQFTRGETAIPDIGHTLGSDPAILSSMLKRGLEGLDRLLRNGNFTQAQEADRASLQFRSETDSVFAYWSERSVADPDAKVPRSEVYVLYKSWCHETGRSSVSQSMFGKRTKDQLKHLGADLSYLTMKFPDGISRQTWCYTGRRINRGRFDVRVDEGKITLIMDEEAS